MSKKRYEVVSLDSPALGEGNPIRGILLPNAPLRMNSLFLTPEGALQWARTHAERVGRPLTNVGVVELTLHEDGTATTHYERGTILSIP